MKHPILALHGAKESCQSQKSCKCTWIFVLTTGGSAVAERIPQKIGSRQQQRSRYREIGGGIGQPITSASIPSAFLNDSYSWHACRSRLKSGTLFTCDQRFVLQKKKSAQCESISHCALEKPHSVKKPQAPNFRKLALRAPG